MKDVTRIQGLEALVKAQAGGKPPPVESWDPPYCGDIGMSIKADGTWFYQGSPIGRAPLVKLFASILRRDADGRYYLVTPAEKVDVAVADAPFLAVEMQVDGVGSAQQLTFRTNVDDVVVCGPGRPLRFEIQLVDKIGTAAQIQLSGGVDRDARKGAGRKARRLSGGQNDVLR